MRGGSLARRFVELVCSANRANTRTISLFILWTFAIICLQSRWRESCISSPSPSITRLLLFRSLKNLSHQSRTRLDSMIWFLAVVTIEGGPDQQSRRERYSGNRLRAPPNSIGEALAKSAVSCRKTNNKKSIWNNNSSQNVSPNSVRGHNAH